MASESSSEQAVAHRTLEEAREVVRLGAREMYADTAPHERRLRASLRASIGELYAPMQEVTDRIVRPVLAMAPQLDPSWPPARVGFRPEEAE